MKILIPNATGPTNIGDQAILEVLLHLIDGSISEKSIVIHTKNPELYQNKYPYTISPSIFQYVALESSNAGVSLYRLLKLLLYVLTMRTGLFALTPGRKNDPLLKLLEDYRNADIIIFPGGGYLRARAGIKQALNLLLQVLPFMVAKLGKSVVIVAPISFGPFAYRWQAHLTARILNGCDVVSTREAQSYRDVQILGVKNLLLLNDLALLIKKSKPVKTKHSKKDKAVIGFTIRQWLPDQLRQEKLEQAYADALMRLSQKIDAVVQPIIQVQSPDFPLEDDARAVDRVCLKLKAANVPVRTPIRIRSVNQATEVYGQLDVLLGMRMHSNILAAVQGIPFVAISYEPKTEGIAKQIDMKKYCLKCELVKENNLYHLLIDAYTHRNYLKNKLIQSIKTIQDNETQRWNYLFQEAKTYRLLAEKLKLAHFRSGTRIPRVFTRGFLFSK